MNNKHFLDSIILQFAALRKEVEKEFYYLEEDELKRHEGEAWSIGECIEHLNLVNERYVTNIKKALNNPSKRKKEGYRATWIGNLLIRSNKPKQGNKIPFPTKTSKDFIPQRDRRPQAIFLDFNSILGELEALVEQSKEVSLNTRVRTLIPILSIRLADAFEVLIAHMERHILQAKRLK